MLTNNLTKIIYLSIKQYTIFQHIPYHTQQPIISEQNINTHYTKQIKLHPNHIQPQTHHNYTTKTPSSN